MKTIKHSSKKRAVVLLSGGLDSATVLYHALSKGFECHCLLFDYGQRHRRELNAAKKIAKRAGCPFTALKIRLPWGGSALLDKKEAIPSRDISSHHLPLPSTYVPGRNTIFISFALSLAETIGAPYVFIGANAVDYSGYPDCRPRYYDAWNKVLDALGTHVRIRIPLLHLNKAQIIRLGIKLGVPYGDTWSCYKGGNKPCGVCDSCRFRAKGFAEAGSSDPALQRPAQRSSR